MILLQDYWNSSSDYLSFAYEYTEFSKYTTVTESL